MAEVPRGCAGQPGKWYNMRYIDMSGKLPMCRRTENAQVRYSAAYPTGRERIAKGLLHHGGRPHSITNCKI